MRKAVLSSILILFLLVQCSEKEKMSPDEPGFLVDDMNRKLKIENIPERVISLAPNLTEMIYLLGMGHTLVGNTTYCNFPPEAQEIQKVGDLLNVDYELILELQPDIVFMTVEGNKKDSFEKMLKLGINIFVSNPRDFEGIKKTCNDIAEIYQAGELADKILEKWDKTVNEISVEFNLIPPRSAMFLVEVSPIMIAGESTFLNEYLKYCNLKNIAHGMDINYPVFGREEILKVDPVIILYPSQSTFDKNEILDLYPEWRDLSSYREDNIIVVDSDLYFRPGPRFVDALEDLSNKLKIKIN